MPLLLGPCVIIIVPFLSLSSCTDLAAVYKHDILILPNADSILPDSPISWKSLSLTLPTLLSYPVGLTHDSINNRLFVAEAKPKEEGKIISLALNDHLEVVDMTPVVRSNRVSVIEGMSYSAKSEHLYWTDASVQYIYKAMVPSERGGTVSRPEVIHDLGSRHEPRALAVDPCNEFLYWSEKGGGLVHSSVEMWHPGGSGHHFIQDDGKNNFYQGLSFDAASRHLMWAVTDKDELNSTCRIVKTSIDNMRHEDVVTLENCYPFSLTSDEKYIYWSDWGRHGIMRASLTNPRDIVKLVDTPYTVTEKDEHFGVYGLAKLIKQDHVDESLCKDKDGKTQNYEDLNTAQNPKLEVNKNTEGTNELKEVSHGSSVDAALTKGKENDQSKESEQVPNNSGANKAKVNNEKEREPIENGSSKDSEEIEVEENLIVHKDRIVMSLQHSLLQHQEDATPREPEGEAILESVESVTGVNNDKTQTDQFPLLSTSDLAATESFPQCPEGRLVIILVLSAVCFLLFGSNVILAVLLCRRRSAVYKGAASAVMLEAPQAVPVQPPPRQVKRFGPKKSFVSANKTVHSGSAVCSGLANDGVTISIEDCCQMTLCETPCYTTVKKQGKSYKDFRKNKYDDKKGLLDDCEEI